MAGRRGHFFTLVFCCWALFLKFLSIGYWPRIIWRCLSLNNFVLLGQFRQAWRFTVHFRLFFFMQLSKLFNFLSSICAWMFHFHDLWLKPFKLMVFFKKLVMQVPQLLRIISFNLRVIPFHLTYLRCQEIYLLSVTVCLVVSFGTSLTPLRVDQWSVLCIKKRHQIKNIIICLNFDIKLDSKSS